MWEGEGCVGGLCVGGLHGGGGRGLWGGGVRQIITKVLQILSHKF